MVKEDIEVVVGVIGVFVDEFVFVGFVDCVLEDGGFFDEFIMNVDIGSGCVYGLVGDEVVFNKFVGVFVYNFVVFVCFWFIFVSVYDEILRFCVFVLIFEVYE